MSVGPILCLALTPAVQRTLFMEAMRPGEVNRARRTRISAAGKGVNVAAALARLGARPRLIGFRGGPSGAFIARALNDLGVDAHWIETEAETRHCHTAVEGDGTRVTEWVEEAAPPTLGEWATFDRLFAEQAPECSWLAISGALPPGAPAERLMEIARGARKAGLALLIDSQGAPLRAALDAKPDWVKLNSEELEITTGLPARDPTSCMAAMRALRARGAQNVLVTAGADECCLLAGESSWRIQPPTVKALNPIGSGDSVTAGLLHGLTTGRSAIASAVWGIACGSANAMSEIPALFDRADVEALLSRVRVTSIDG